MNKEIGLKGASPWKRKFGSTGISSPIAPSMPPPPTPKIVYELREEDGKDQMMARNDHP
jgi:hypothetical protein